MRRNSRAKRGFFWTGFQGSVSVNNATNYVIDVYDPALSSLGDTKDLRHEKTVIWLGAQASTAAVYLLSFALQHCQTDLSLGTANILDPSSNDIDLFNKRQVMWGGAMYTASNAQQPIMIYEMIESKRKLDSAQEAIVFAMRTNNANATSVGVWIRSLYSKRA